MGKWVRSGDNERGCEIFFGHMHFGSETKRKFTLNLRFAFEMPPAENFYSAFAIAASNPFLGP